MYRIFHFIVPYSWVSCTGTLDNMMTVGLCSPFLVGLKIWHGRLLVNKAALNIIPYSRSLEQGQKRPCFLWQHASISHHELRVSREIVVWTYGTFDNNTGIMKDFEKYLKRRVVGNVCMSHLQSRVSWEIIFWTYGTFDNDTGIMKDFETYLKKICR